MSLCLATDTGGQTPVGLGRFGEVLDAEPPKVRLRVQRGVIADVLASVLDKYSVEDVSVEDPPLEEVIAELFSVSNGEANGEPATI